MSIRLLSACLCLSIGSAQSIAGEGAGEGERQSMAEIRQTVSDFLAAQMGTSSENYQISVALADNRLDLSRCRQPLDVFVQSGGIEKGSVSVGVRCRDETSWLIYLQAQIKRFEEVVVLLRPVDRGGVVTPEVLALERRDVSHLRQGYLTTIDGAVNMRAKRLLPTGSVLTQAVLEQPKMIRRGEIVAIVAQSGALDIRMHGKAMMDGAAGQRITVRNENSSRVVQGVVAAPGLVKVTF